MPCGRKKAKYKFLFKYQINSSLVLKTVNRQQLVINIKKCSKSMVTCSIEKGKSGKTKGHIQMAVKMGVLGSFCLGPCLSSSLQLLIFSRFPWSLLKFKNESPPPFLVWR